MFTFGSAKLVTTVNKITPKMSSIKAAPKIMFPDGVDKRPISFKVSTEILTEVAVKIRPINTLLNTSVVPNP